jgi:hypothetical protein
MAKSFLKAPPSGSVRLINFTRAQVVPGIVPCTFFLIVSGTKPYLNMTVELKPLIYVQQPDYWGIEVVGSLHGIGIPVTAPYTVFIPLNHIIGKKGIEVIGANRKQKINVPKCDPADAGKKSSKKSSKKK